MDETRDGSSCASVLYSSRPTATETPIGWEPEPWLSLLAMLLLESSRLLFPRLGYVSISNYSLFALPRRFRSVRRAGDFGRKDGYKDLLTARMSSEPRDSASARRRSDSIDLVTEPHSSRMRLSLRRYRSKRTLSRLLHRGQPPTP